MLRHRSYVSFRVSVRNFREHFEREIDLTKRGIPSSSCNSATRKRRRRKRREEEVARSRFHPIPIKTSENVFLTSVGKTRRTHARNFYLLRGRLSNRIRVMNSTIPFQSMDQFFVFFGRCPSSVVCAKLLKFWKRKGFDIT